jgi:hypothetical protein
MDVGELKDDWQVESMRLNEATKSMEMEKWGRWINQMELSTKNIDVNWMISPEKQKSLRLMTWNVGEWDEHVM